MPGYPNSSPALLQEAGARSGLGGGTQSALWSFPSVPGRRRGWHGWCWRGWRWRGWRWCDGTTVAGTAVMASFTMHVNAKN